MDEKAARSRTGQEKFIVIALLSLLLIIGDSSRAWAARLRGSATVSASSTKTKTNGLKDSIFSLDQRYLLGWDVELTPLLRWRTDGRDLESRDDTDLGTSSERDLELFSELLLLSPAFEWSGGLRLSSDTSDRPGTEEETIDENFIFSRLTWRPIGLPTLSIQYEREKSYGDLPVGRMDNVRDRVFVASEYAYGPLRLLDNFTYEREDDRAVRTTEDRIENLGRVNFQQRFWQERLSLLGNYQINYDRREETAERTVTVQTLRLARRGLYAARDTTPADGQLDETPDLIDSDLTNPALDRLGNRINIGGGNTFRNIGVELRTAEIVNQIFVYVRPGDPDLTGLIRWSVYISDNGQTWSVLGGNAVFNPAESRYEISFTEPDPHRFFKVVNENTSTIQDSLVTEIEAVGFRTLVEGEAEVFTTLIQDFNSTVRFSPFRIVSLTYDLFYSRSDRERDGEGLTESRTNHGLTLRVDPLRTLSTVFRYERTLFDAEQEVDTLTNRYSITLLYTPWETLNATLSATRSELSEDGEDRSRFDSISLQVISQLYRDVNLVTEMGYSESRDFVADTEIESFDWRVDLDTVLRKDLTATLSYVGSRDLQKPRNLITREDEASLLLIWRPTRMLNLSGEWGYLRQTNLQGLFQRYTLDWLPFPDGNIDLNFFYEMENDEAANRTRHRFNGGLRWAINRKTDFRFDYTFDRDANGFEEEVQGFNATLDIRF